MRTKGSANRHHYKTPGTIKDDFIKFRCPESFKGLVKRFRAEQPAWVARKSESEFYRSLILHGMLKNGMFNENLNAAIQDEIEKI